MEPETTKKQLTRPQVAFAIGAILLGLVFVLSLMGILTNRFRPFASELGAPTPEGSPVPPVTLTIQNGEIVYEDSDGNDGQAGANSVTLDVLSSQINAIFSLQGVDNLAEGVETISGRVTIVRSDNKSLVAQARWTSPKKRSDDPRLRFVAVTDETLRQNVANAISGGVTAFDILLKPDCYLAVAQRNIASGQIYGTTSFTQPGLPGDLNGDNRVTEPDYAIWFVHLGETDVNDLCLDPNNNHVVDEADYAIMFAADHFGRHGEEP